MMQLYLVHCGFYDEDIGSGIYECHMNLFVVATSFDEARTKAKQQDVFRTKRMHVDGIQQISVIDGWAVSLNQDLAMADKTVILSHKHRDLAPRPPV